MLNARMCFYSVETSPIISAMILQTWLPPGHRKKLKADIADSTFPPRYHFVLLALHQNPAMKIWMLSQYVFCRLLVTPMVGHGLFSS